jgi:tetratricopeptide (TPR) repeat protein
MLSRILLITACVGAILPGSNVQAQVQNTVPSYTTTLEIENGQPSLVLVVLDSSRSHLDRQSVVELNDLARKTSLWRTTENDSEVTLYDLAAGDYDLEISAVGYKPQHKRVQVQFAHQNLRVEVQLERDPSAVDLNTSDDVVPPKYRKDVKRAVYALKSGKLAEAQKQLDKIYRFAPDSAQINFLYGYLFLGFKDLDKSESYLSRAAVLDPRREQTLSLLGRVQLQRQHDHDAQTTLEQAIAINPQDWMAHDLLAHAYLSQKQYERARQQAQLAIEQNLAAASAQMVLGDALIGLGHDQEGTNVLRAFLNAHPEDPDRPQVQALLAQIDAHQQSRATVPAQLPADHALESLPSLPLTAWGPPGVDDQKLPVAAGVVCPYDQILEMSGKRVQELVDNVSQFAATENLLHERLDRFGNPTLKENRKFDYLAGISEYRPGYFTVDEDRILRSSQIDVPDGIVTRGFMSLALIFHPDMRDDFQMTCEGLSQSKGQATWLMYFRQRDDRPNRFGEFLVGTQPHAVQLKGRAWIAANNFEIVRMESELMKPVGKLSVEHQIVQYGPVHFNKQNLDLWLPQSVDLYLEINQRRYYRRHSFDDYVLFSVDAQPRLPVMKAGPNHTLVPDDQHRSDPPVPCQTSCSLSK